MGGVWPRVMQDFGGWVQFGQQDLLRGVHSRIQVEKPAYLDLGYDFKHISVCSISCVGYVIAIHAVIIIGLIIIGGVGHALIGSIVILFIGTVASITKIHSCCRFSIGQRSVKCKLTVIYAP